MRKTRSRSGSAAGIGARLVVILGLVATGAVAAPTPAFADVCGTPGCGGVVTNGTTNLPIRVANTWCDPNQIRYYGDDLPCVQYHNDPNHYNADYELPPRATTYNLFYYYDTDAVRAYRGCVTRFSQGASVFTYDRRGKSSVWIKIYNGDRINVTAIVCG